MKQSLGPIGDVDMLTSQELHDSLGHHFSAFVREAARGVDYLGFFASPNAGTVQVPGPDSGYVWSLKLVSAQLSAAGALSVYPGENNAVAPYGASLSTVNGANNEVVMTFTSNVVVIKDQRSLFLASGVNILSYRILVKQVPAEMQAKL